MNTDKNPGQEGFWSELAEEAADDSGTLTTVRDRLIQQLDADQIHGVVGSARRGDTVYLIISYTVEKPGGDATHLRTVVVDEAAGTVKISDNGMWFPSSADTVDGLIGAMARTHTDLSGDGHAEPVTKSTSAVDVDDVLARPVEADEYEAANGGWGESWGNGNGPPPQVHKLHQRLSEADLPTARYSRLDFGKSTPWERYANRDCDELLGNYGVETGHPFEEADMDDRVLGEDQLVIVDVDDPDAAPVEQLPETFSVSSPTGGDDRAHHYYKVPDKAALYDAFGSWAIKPGWGDIWVAGEYVAGPGCYREATDDKPGGRYEIVSDRPIRQVSADDLMPLLGEPDEDEADDDTDELDFDRDTDEEEADDTDDEPDERTVTCALSGREIPRDEAVLRDVDGSAQYVDQSEVDG